MTARQLLGAVLREARETVDRSPEQVGSAAGVSGRTIRRLEEPGPDTTRPRGVTLDALASFYGLRTSFVRQLAEWGDAAGEPLAELLRDAAAAALGAEVVEGYATGDDDELTTLAMRVARHSAPRPEAPAMGPEEAPARRMFVSFTHGSASWPALERSGEGEAAIALLEDFLALDRRRQRMLRDLAQELRAARDRERAQQREGD